MAERQYPPFVYKGEIVDETIGSLMDALVKIDQAEEAAVFMAEYRKVNPHADENVGYLLGYVEPPERRRGMYDLFMVKHPVFGGSV